MIQALPTRAPPSMKKEISLTLCRRFSTKQLQKRGLFSLFSRATKAPKGGIF
jgi:hypothetical protein